MQMVASGAMISAGSIQMSNETQIIHQSHSQHIIQNTLMEMRTHHSSGTFQPIFHICFFFYISAINGVKSV